MQLQRAIVHLTFLSGGISKHHFVKVIVEWDETSQYMRLRRGLIAVEGVMPTLVSCRELEIFSRLRSVACCSSCFLLFHIRLSVAVKMFPFDMSVLV